MTDQVINLLNVRHQQVLELLPWYVMDALDTDERIMIERHLGECDLCRRELDWQQQLRAAHDEPLPDCDVDGALSRLHAREPELQAAKNPSSPAARPQRRWLYRAMAAQLVVIFGLGALVMLDHTRPLSYHALAGSGEAQASARLVVMFTAQTTVTEMRETLRRSRARIVDGPTVNGAYVLAVAPSDEKRAIEKMRSSHSVKLVQSLGTDASP